MSAWFNLFADLDPLANPDAIGKKSVEEDRNCWKPLSNFLKWGAWSGAHSESCEWEGSTAEPPCDIWATQRPSSQNFWLWALKWAVQNPWLSATCLVLGQHWFHAAGLSYFLYTLSVLFVSVGAPLLRKCNGKQQACNFHLCWSCQQTHFMWLPCLEKSHWRWSCQCYASSMSYIVLVLELQPGGAAQQPMWMLINQNCCPVFSLLYSLSILYAVLYLNIAGVHAPYVAWFCVNMGGLGGNKVQLVGRQTLKNACHEPLRTFLIHLLW